MQAQASRISWTVALIMYALSSATILIPAPEVLPPQEFAYQTLLPYLVAWTTRENPLADPRNLLPWVEFLEKKKKDHPAFLVDPEILLAWKGDIQTPGARKTLGFLHEMKSRASARGIPIFMPALCEGKSTELETFKRTGGDPVLTQLAWWIINESWNDGFSFLYYDGINQPNYSQELFRKPAVKGMILEILKRAPPGGVAHLYALAGQKSIPEGGE